MLLEYHLIIIFFSFSGLQNQYSTEIEKHGQLITMLNYIWFPFPTFEKLFGIP